MAWRRVMFGGRGALAAGLWAQPTPPAGERGKGGRGWRPGGGFLVSDVETINMVNGNVLLRIPLASLPAGRGGSGFTLELRYNSQIWDVEPSLITSGQDSDGNDTYESRHTLQMSAQGGWRYGFEYGLELEDRTALTGGNECRTIFDKYNTKMRVHFPDGSAHLLRLVNTEDTQGDNRGDGFYAYSPTGRRDPCYTGGSNISGDVRYVTTDGAYAHVTVHSGTGAWTQRRWTIHFNDGTRVEGKRDQTERIVDRNGNTITVERRTNCTYGEGTELQENLLCTFLRDDLGREIKIVRLEDGDEAVTAPGYGGELEWKIERGTVNMSGGTYACGGDSDCAARDAGTIDKIELPQLEGQQQLEYVFAYHRPTTAFGELQKIDFPGGGSVTYDYTYRQHKAGSTLLENPVTQKVVTYTEPLTGTELSETWTYAIDVNNVTTVTAPDGGAAKTWFYENKYVAASSPDAWKTGLVWKTTRPNGDKTERYWRKNQAYNSPAIHASDPGNPYVRAEYSTQGAQTAARAMTRDKNGNLLTAAEYDFGVTVGRDSGGIPNAAPTGTPLRTAVHVYTQVTPNADRLLDDRDAYWRAPPAAARLLSLADYSEVRAGRSNGTLQAKTDFTYDARGNVTAAARGVGGATATTRHAYDTHGNLTQTTDARNNRVKLTYDAIAGCPAGSAASLYPTKREEAYNETEERTTSYDYDDLGRPTEVGEKALQEDEDENVEEMNLRKTQTAYDDQERRVYEQRDRATYNDAALAVASRYDPLGRLWLEQTNGAGKVSAGSKTSGIQVRRAYRYSGSNRYELTSNPHESAGGSEETMGWRRAKYDRNGRVVEAAAFAGDGRPAPWGTNASGRGKVTTAYSSNTVTVTDEAGVRRVSTYDGLGRLARVEENGVHTCYEYDVLDNLTKVRQGAAVSGSGVCTGGQARTFVYDALSRLTSATNPENGTVGYTYDGAGNVLTETDGRGGTATHTYDALNRITKTVYSGGGTGFDATPDVTYAYDAGATTNCKNKGRLTSVSTSVSTTGYGCYDALGRVTASTQTTSGDAARTFAYTYNADGTLETQTYPSGLVVAYEYDAAGRFKAVGKNTPGATDYAGEMSYAAHGGIKALKLGNGLYESWGYNARLQPTAIRLGTAASGTQRADKLSLAFDYGTTSNNGNVLSQTIGREGLSGTLTQRYRYDGANRLGLASEGGTAPTSDSCPTDAAWRRDYTYDAYDNRAVTGTRGHTLPTGTPTATSAFSTTTNRIAAGSYDGAGNLLSLTGVGALSYDAENRLTAYDNNVASLQEQGAYAYDGLGQRVKRTTTIRGASETMVYVYDAFGRLAAEYSSVAPVAGSGGTFYRTEDHLGSTRLVTKQDKSVVECRDFFPFGERIGSGLNGRSADCYGGTSSAVKQQFTGKERDEESSLDYFGARYYSARLGRFLSVDPLLSSGRPSDPQSWNRYSYSFNNPLIFKDPTGLYVCAGDDQDCTDFAKALKQVKQARDSFKQGSDEYNRLNDSLQAYGKEGVDNGVTINFVKSGPTAHTAPGTATVEGTANKAVTEDNPTGQNTTVTFNIPRRGRRNSLAIATAHEGVHVRDGAALSGALPTDLSDPSAIKILQGPLNLREYLAEKRAYEASAFAAQGLGFSSLKVVGFEIWNSGWRAADANTLTTKGIDKILADPNGSYGVTPESPGRRLIPLE